VLLEKLSQVFKQNSKAHWLELCQKAGIPASPINTLTEAFTDIQATQRNLVETLQHPLLEKLQVIASPFKASGGSSKLAPPLLGQHTSEILQQVLGMTKETVDHLISTNVIHQPES
jgi:formyl-CoA transferase